MEDSKPTCLRQRFAPLQLVLFIIGNSCIFSSAFTIIKHICYELLRMSEIKAHHRRLVNFFNLLKKLFFSYFFPIKYDNDPTLHSLSLHLFYLFHHFFSSFLFCSVFFQFLVKNCNVLLQLIFFLSIRSQI